MIIRVGKNWDRKRTAWSVGELQKLRRLAREGTAAAAAKVLGRSAAAVRMKAMKCGISFRPAQPAALRSKS